MTQTNNEHENQFDELLHLKGQRQNGFPLGV
jgi:hypothetical protein